MLFVAFKDARESKAFCPPPPPLPLTNSEEGITTAVDQVNSTVKNT